MSAQSKPSIVFCRGLWADGSCFSKVIAPLQVIRTAASAFRGSAAAAAL